jgi:diguanylate cyclase (GGDEF)-like protein
MTAGSTPHPSRYAWAAYTAVALVGVATYQVLPRDGSAGVVRVVLYCGISASACVAILVGVRLWRPRPRLPWVLLALSQLLYVAGEVTFHVTHDVLGIEAFPGPSDVLRMVHYPLLVAALVLLVRRRAPGSGLAGVLDAATIAVVAAMLSWLFIMGPQLRADAPWLEKVVCVSVPAADLAMLVVGLRLILERGRRPASFFLLCGSLAVILVADTWYVWQAVNRTYETGGLVDLLWLVGHALLGAAALHPTMARLAEPQPPAAVAGPGHLRIAALAAAVMVAPATLLLQADRTRDADLAVAAVACAAIFVLTILRMSGLVSDQRRLASTDGLTGLATRRHLEHRLAAELARARRTGGELALFLVDVDHFKLVNDRHGHPAGDRVLVEIGARLASCSSGGVLARFGGEEFALLVPGAGPATLAGTAERLRDAVASSPVALGGESWTSVTVSVGAAAFPEHAATGGELVGVVDGALYAAKARGRDRAVIGPVPRSPATVLDGASSMLDYLTYAADDVDVRMSGYEHSCAIARWSRVMADALGLDADTVRRVELAARLHDVGKVVVPDAVLVKPSRLSADEWALMAQHAEHGYRMTRAVPGLASVAETIRQHHERFDGTGYPHGLAGRDIRVEARVIAVCDSWAAMRADRPYQAVLAEEDARDELLRGRGTQFDGDLVELFVDLRDRGLIGDLRRLRTGPAVPAPASPGNGLAVSGATRPGRA